MLVQKQQMQSHTAKKKKREKDNLFLEILDRFDLTVILDDLSGMARDEPRKRYICTKL